MSKTGVFQAHKKDNTVYYRSSITYKGKHISLGSFPTEEDASAAYEEAGLLLRSQLSLEQTFSHSYHLPFAKIVSLINYRDHGIYLRNPIYLQEKFFYYYLDEKTPLKFDIDDLFYDLEKKHGFKVDFDTIDKITENVITVALRRFK